LLNFKLLPKLFAPQREDEDEEEEEVGALGRWAMPNSPRLEQFTTASPPGMKTALWLVVSLPSTSVLVYAREASHSSRTSPRCGSKFHTVVLVNPLMRIRFVA
jgi:hypothetical protein